ncbi:heme/copper-type cytochrome/quinol oxidase subunit 3 [Nocardia sp. GAS34]
MNKYFEYSAQLHAGVILTSNDFYLYFFVFTGIHAVHVLIGMCILTWLAIASGGDRPRAVMIIRAETGATYWHMVDLLWIVLFPMFYLL